MTQVSILVAAYNAAATLPCCLDSLRAQTVHDIEVLCVDDCSTDQTLPLLRRYAAEDPRIRVFQTPANSGQAVARNLALQHARAPFVCMVDADDWLSPDALEQALQVFSRHPQTDCVLFRLMMHEQEDGSEHLFPLSEALTAGNAMSGREAFEACLNGWQLHGLYLTRTRLHRQIPFDTATRLYSDDNTSRLHYLHSREVRACSGTYYYRRHEASMTASFNLRRFDFMEANLSLLFALKKENLPRRIIRRYEGSRWMTFIACYRLYLQHRSELTPDFEASLRDRFRTVLHTFRPSRLPLRYRWRPGYWLTLSLPLFDLQQRAYRRLHTIAE